MPAEERKRFMDDWLISDQPRLHGVGMVALLVFTAFITPASLDMYTPALPQMVVAFNSTEAILNLTLAGFYLFFAFGQLLLGPVSDRFGRRPLLIAGSTVYLGGSIACALASHIVPLVVFRIIQSIGAGAIASISMAMVKDVFVPEKRDIAFSLITSLFGVGPVAAPIVGAACMGIGGWRAIFWALAIFGVGCLLFALLLKEPIRPTAGEEGAPSGNVIGGLVRVLKNKGFTLYMTIAALFSLPFMAYVAIASHVYITFFGLNEMQYGIYFGIASALMIVGPFLWMLMKRFMTAKRYTTFLVVCAGLVGVAMLAVGQSAPVAFCACFGVFMLLEASVRPFSANILLSQSDEDVGAAAALTNCSHTLLGFFGMLLAVLPWPNYIIGLGVLIIVSLALAGLLWVWLLKSDARLDGVK